MNESTEAVVITDLRKLPGVLRQLRQSMGLSLREAGKLLNYSGASISLWERQVHRISIVTLMQWARGMGFEVTIHIKPKGQAGQ